MTARPDLAARGARADFARPIAPYVGGKKHLARRLVARIRDIPHDLYAEPFVGLGGVFLRRTERARVEVINDLSDDVANLFRVAQRHPDALAAQMRFALHARAQWDELMRRPPETLTDIERAARFVQLQRSAFGGKAIARNFAMTKAARHVKAYAQSDLRENLDALHARLARVTIEQLPFADFIARYDGPTTLFFLDPPYWGSEGYYGEALFTRDDFDRLRQALAGIRGRFLMTINDRPETRALFAEFTLDSVGLTYGLAAAGATQARELIVSNGPAGLPTDSRAEALDGDGQGA